ncbi:hypothetical protein Riv7116_5979 [Rivularia sp. PCC 7116]|uniref:hypothetical protein n=1 Tax=Rivularia sp. PCC 7116 TaxID=373994 RepID=UPI00029EE8C3|nr:hypothetical protein [Rivularia sp. PCC 7116]AFY58340.1 hypothetical protein Riv7116_5979 [Rivularia sp. PCC 7116]
MTHKISMETNDVTAFAITGISLDIPNSKQTSKITAMELKQPLPVKDLSIDYAAKPKTALSSETDLSIDRDATKNLTALQPATNRKYGSISMAAASASVRIVKSPTFNKYGNQGRSEPRITKTESLNVEAEDNSLDITHIDLPIIEFHSKPKIILKTRQAAQIETEEIPEATPQKKLAVNSVFGNKRNSLSNKDYSTSVDNSENIASSEFSSGVKAEVNTVEVDSTNQKEAAYTDSSQNLAELKLTDTQFSEFDVSKNSPLVETANNLPDSKTSSDRESIVKADLDNAVDDIPDDSDQNQYSIDADSGDDVIHVSNRVTVIDGTSDDEFNATDGDDIFYLGSNSILEGGIGDDKFFVQSGGDNILFGGKGSDEFWIFNGEIPESANIIADFEVGNDVIGIVGSSSLGIDASTLDLQEVDGNTEVLIKNQTLAVFNNVTASDIHSSIVFI